MIEENKMPMQELIEQIDAKLELFKDFNPDDRFNQGMLSHLRGCKSMAVGLLEKEANLLSNKNNDWIKLEDGTPENDTSVFVYIQKFGRKFGEYHTAYYCDGKWDVLLNEGIKENYNDSEYFITHWKKQIPPKGTNNG